MNLSDRLEEFLTAESMALIRLVKTEAERLDLPLYIVGGSVRDLLLGRAIKDFDFTVEGDAAKLAEALLKKYAGNVVFHTRFGTATWSLDESTYKRLNVPLVGASDFPPFLDLISARSETYSQPGALPTIQRSSIDDDLRRRDFTINALAVRLDGAQYGQLHDPLGGRPDLERGLIRVLHETSFLDDPTRMLRAVRYAGRYSFEIEPKTIDLINDEAKSVLASLSGERLRHEIDLIFKEQHPPGMLNRLSELGLLEPIHPSLPKAGTQLFSLETSAAEFWEFNVPEVLGWITWLMLLSSSEIEEIAKRLDFPGSLSRSVHAAASLLEAMPAFTNWKPSQWTLYLDELPTLAIYAVYRVTKEKSLREYLLNWQHVKQTITGNDLKARGLEPGPRYAEILRHLRAAWLDGEVESEEEEMKFLATLLHGE